MALSLLPQTTTHIEPATTKSVPTITLSTSTEPYLHPLPPVAAVEDKPLSLQLAGSDTECNCYAFVEAFLGLDLPRMVTLSPNVATPEPGDVAIFQYPSAKHVAIVRSVASSTFQILESNFRRCQIGERSLPFNYPRLVGFYRP